MGADEEIRVMVDKAIDAEALAFDNLMPEQDVIQVGDLIDNLGLPVVQIAEAVSF
jgi:hypothetical protein